MVDIVGVEEIDTGLEVRIAGLVEDCSTAGWVGGSCIGSEVVG